MTRLLFQELRVVQYFLRWMRPKVQYWANEQEFSPHNVWVFEKYCFLFVLEY